MSGNLITPQGRLSFPQLFEPREINGSEPKYGATIIFEDNDDPQLKAMKEAALEAAREKFGAKTDQLIKAKKIKWPFLDGATELRDGFGEGKVFIRPTSKQQPGCVDRYAGSDGKPKPITEAGELYAGCYVRASLRPFAYDTNGNKGVSFGLQNIQKLDEGERLDGRAKAEDEFEAIETSPVAMNGADELDDILA
ncbi:MAG: DUF2815 family protein [Geminicoccaceae bacterium]